MLTLSKLVRAAWPLLLSLGLGACGGDDKKDDAKGCTGEDCKPGSGFNTKAKDGKVVLDFTGVEAGAQFVLMPYLLGNVEGGALTGPKYTFTATAGTGAGLRLAEPTLFADDPAQMALAMDHDRRTLANRFDPAKGLDQGEDFWAIARALDRRAAVGASFLAGTAAVTADSTEGRYRRAAQKGGARSLRSPLALTTDGGCPTGKLVIPDDDLAADTVAMPAAAIDGGDYCLVFIDAPVTESDKAAIEATVKTVVKSYKETIYKNAMVPAGGFTFKPVVAIIDFTNTDHWPGNKDFKLAGAFIGKMAKEAKQPMLYMMSDFSKLPSPPGGSDAALAKKLWHSTVAHEMQHAIMDYFRNYVNSPVNPENTAVDEGIAHFMEDAWGYGEENFEGFAKKFLSTFAFGTATFLNAGSGEPQDRGAAQALMFYLSSQKGGVKFDGGKMAGGGGLDFITSVVTNPTGKGAQGLAAKAGGDWSETLGNHLGALILDGLTVDGGVQGKYATQGPVKEVTDLNGNAGKTFGMRFNDFGGVTEAKNFIDDKMGATATAEVTYYQTKPILYTVAGDDAKVTFTLPDGTSAEDSGSAAVSAVRVK